MANCRHCGYPLSENDKTCFMCGTEVQEAPAKPASGSVDFCPDCGCPLDAKDTVCSLCGAEIPGRKPAPAPAQAQPASGGVDFCPSCGCPLDADDTVCSLCGTEIPGRKPAPAPVQEAPAKPASGGVELCPSCGCPLDADDTVCSLCGTAVPGHHAAPKAPPVAKKPQPQAQTQTQFVPQPSYQPAAAEEKRPAKWLTFLFGYLMPFIALIVWLLKRNSSAWVREDVKRGMVWFGVMFLLIAVTGGALIPVFPIAAVVGAVLACRK